jgi:hypothetical protein
MPHGVEAPPSVELNTNMLDFPASPPEQAKALRKLKHPSRSRKMRSFLDQ